MSTSLAVRHRPTTWDEVAGQRHLVAVLRAAAARRPVPQQILLSGPSGVGKTTLARIFVAALFCPNSRDGQGCGTCETCRDVTGPGGRHPDVIEVDAASHGGVDQVRALSDGAHMAPMVAPWRVYIIDEAHGLTAAGGQAFLKALEEPPPHTVFVLATTDPQKLPSALRGRCLLCHAGSPTRQEKVDNLLRIAATESWSVSRELAELVVDASDTELGVRGTVTSLEKVAGSGAAPTLEYGALLLGAADPKLFADLVAHTQAGRVAEGLTALARICETTPRQVVHAQLYRHAESELRAAVSAGNPAAGLVWLDALAATPPQHLELAVAKIGFHGSRTSLPAAHPPPAPETDAGPTPAAPAAAEPHRAESLSGLGATPPDPVGAPAAAPSGPSSTPPPASPILVHEPAVSVAASRPAQDAPGSPGSDEPVDEARELNGWLNRVAASGDVKSAVALRRSAIRLVDGVWDVQDCPAAGELNFSDIVTALAGRPVRVS